MRLQPSGEQKEWGWGRGPAAGRGWGAAEPPPPPFPPAVLVYTDPQKGGFGFFYILYKLLLDWFYSFYILRGYKCGFVIYMYFVVVKSKLSADPSP